VSKILRADDIVWYSASDGSWGGCESDSMIIVRKADMTEEELSTLSECCHDEDAYDVIAGAHARVTAMKKATVMWTVVETDSRERGADALIGARGLFSTEEEAIVHLTDIRDDDPDTGDGWTTVPIIIYAA
jgi:hypothetical protein